MGAKGTVEEAVKSAMENGVVRGIITRLTMYVETMYAEDIKKCESPIERQLFTNLVYTQFMEQNSHAAYDFHVFPQKKLIIQFSDKEASYRIDFWVTFWEKKNPENTIDILVECDGHEFHEKTKEQAKRDKMKDRHLQRAGYKILRYTGSEIYKNSFKCADEIITFGVHLLGLEKSLTNISKTLFR